MPVEFELPGVYVEENALPPSISLGETALTAFVGRVARGRARTAEVQSFSEFGRRYGDDGGPLATAVKLFFDNGGGRALIVPRPRSGLDDRAKSILDVRDFQLLCLPVAPNENDLPLATHAAAASLCTARKAIYLADAPASWMKNEHPAVTALADVERNFPKSPDAALFFPWLQIDGDRIAGPAAAVAGVMARTDAQRGVWKAAAGLEATISGATGPVARLNDQTAGNLNQASINTLRIFPPRSFVVWGVRTLAGPAGDSEGHLYIPIRRLRHAIDRAVTRGLAFAAFEPNGEPLWAQVRLTVSSFLHGLFRQGAFAGEKSQDAYFVRCDASTMTQGDIETGRLVVDIGFAPLKPAEFIVLRIVGLTAM